MSFVCCYYVVLISFVLFNAFTLLFTDHVTQILLRKNFNQHFFCKSSSSVNAIFDSLRFFCFKNQSEITLTILCSNRSNKLSSSSKGYKFTDKKTCNYLHNVTLIVKNHPGHTHFRRIWYFGGFIII